MKKLLLCLLLSFSGLILFGQSVKLSREKQILLLHNIDSLIQNYEFYCTLSEGIKITENQKLKFLELFQDKNVKVFDDICPNFKNNNELIINEEVKTVAAYVQDISNTYQNLSCGILETDAGTLYNRLQLRKNGIYVPVNMIKEIVAYTKDSLSATYKTSSSQDLMILVGDTITCVPLITEIVKSRCDWDYVPPSAKVSRWEKILNVKSGLVTFKYGDQNQESYMEGLKASPAMGYGIEGEFRYLFKNMETYSYGGSVGLGVSYLKAVYTANSFTSAEEIKDKDNNTYWQIMELASLNENQSIIGINLPVKVSYEKWFSADKGFFFQGGGALTYYTGRYNVKTNYTSTGYYPDYNYLYYDGLPGASDYGFKMNQDYSQKGALNLNPFNAAGSVEMGMFFRFKTYYQIYAGLTYNYSYLSFSPNNESSTLLRPNPNDSSQKPVYNSIISGMGNLYMSVIGIKIGIKKMFKAINNQKIVNVLKPLN
jgi:hypothetical protein